MLGKMSAAMARFNGRLLAQIRAQMGNNSPRAIVIYGTHEPLETTSHTVEALRDHFDSSQICFVKFPNAHRPIDFFSKIFTLFEGRVKRMGGGEVLDLPIASEDQKTIGIEGPALFAVMEEAQQVGISGTQVVYHSGCKMPSMEHLDYDSVLPWMA